MGTLTWNRRPITAPAPQRAEPRRSWRRLRLFVFALAVAMVAFGISAGTVVSLKWMETPEFCGMCHTMKPELMAYEEAPHRNVECAQCHIGAGVGDLVKAKVKGTFQL